MAIKAENLYSQIRTTDPVVILTGAGVSAASGIKTFRDQNGLWENHNINEVATPQAFMQNPELVHRFYNLRRAQLRSVEPNATHLQIARWEQNWSGPFLVISQNVDDLHQRAGTRNLVSMHGQLNSIFCMHCRHKTQWTEDLSVQVTCPNCGKTGGLRPDIVWFGEAPYQIGKIYAALDKAKLFVSIGTSGQVFPAADFVRRVSGKTIKIELNKQATEISRHFDLNIYGNADETTPQLLDALLNVIS